MPSTSNIYCRLPSAGAAIELPDYCAETGKAIPSCFESAIAETDEHEDQPLIPSVNLAPRVQRHKSWGAVRSSSASTDSSVIDTEPDEEDSCIDCMMEKVKDTKVARFVDKLAVTSEPGLSAAQLLLTNYDLKPVEPERRQWGAWNFVGFWIGTSIQCFNLKSTERTLTTPS